MRFLISQAVIGAIALVWTVWLRAVDSWWRSLEPSVPFGRAVAGAWLLLNVAILLRLLFLRLPRLNGWSEHASFAVPSAFILSFYDRVIRARTDQRDLAEDVAKFVVEAIVLTVFLWWLRRAEAKKVVRGA